MKVKHTPSNGRISVSKNFFLDEFSGVCRPDPFQVKNIFKLAAMLETAAKQMGERPQIADCLITLDVQEFAGMEYDHQFANAEAVEFAYPSDLSTVLRISL